MKLRRLSLLCFILLQSCLPESPSSEEATKHQVKLADASAYNTQLGLGYLRQGDRSRAKQKLLLAVSQAPDSPTAHASLAYFFEKSGETDKANEYYKKAVALGKNSGAQLNNYGAFLCRQKQYQQALSYFLLAVKDVQYEHTAAAYENAGLCAMAIPDTKKALGYFKKALVRDPNREQALYELVGIELKQQQVSNALDYLQKYRELTLKNKTILALAVDVAHQASNSALEAEYRQHLNTLAKTGEANDLNNT